VAAVTRYIAFLRAINVGGRNRVAMRDLLGVLDALGLEGGRSLLQSGNLVFLAEGRSGVELERLLEEKTAARLSLRTEYMVRSAEEWERIVARNPFREEAERDPGRLLVMFFKDEPGKDAMTALQAAIKGPERAHVDGKQAYVVYPEGQGRSKLTVDLIERRLQTRGTGRNWNTVVKLAEMLRG